MMENKNKKDIYKAKITGNSIKNLNDYLENQHKNARYEPHGSFALERCSGGWKKIEKVEIMYLYALNNTIS